MTIPLSTPRRMAMLALLVTLGSALGCATTTTQDVAIDGTAPLGPGSNFVSMEAALVDAMTFAHLDAARTRSLDRLRVGAITSTDDGFTYELFVTAPADEPSYARYALTPKDVARVHVYPRSDSTRVNLRNEKHSRADRRSLDRQDPGKRPIYVLTPRLTVKVYRGADAPIEIVGNLHHMAADHRLAAIEDLSM